MKITVTLFLLFISTMCFSQEICDNAIDDDGDGLIDLNDPDCLCHNQQKVTSIISNASFEEKTICPDTYSQLNYCVDWVQATDATTDYLNTCGYLYDGILGSSLMPFPDGNGIVGAIFNDDWKEYMGTCLKEPLIAGTSYQLTFNIAEISNSEENYCVRDFAPVNVTLYGNTNCNMPLATAFSPNLTDATWEIIGSVSYKPAEKWETATINFTPKKDITSIMLGPPETLPAGYELLDITDCISYFLFDNLILNKSSEFPLTAVQTGSYCAEDLVLTASANASLSKAATYQWYKNGIAIIGSTQKSYSIVSNPLNFGNYSVRVSDGVNCYISYPQTISHGILDTPDITFIDIGCNNNNATGTITINAPAAVSYTIDNGNTWSTFNTFTGLPLGDYNVKVKSRLGCESIATTITIKTNIVTAPDTNNVTYCQYYTAEALTAKGSDILWYDSLTSTTPLSTPPLPSTLQPGTFNYYATQTINKCEGPKTLLTVTVLSSPLPPDTDSNLFIYCQDEATLPLNITGTNLIWYSTLTGGNGSNVPPVISSTVPGLSTYFVSQSVNGCESERLKIEVIVNPTPPAPETEAFTSYKQYTASLPLYANGINIKWYNDKKQPLNQPPVIVTDKLAYNTYYASQMINDCESPLAPAVVEIVPNYITIKYPIYFTPNGDGSHETWNIYTPEFGIKATIYIYDRYGKLITSIAAPGTGWDGKLNGSDLPSTDYWFKVLYKQYDVTKEFKSHFSLIR